MSKTTNLFYHVLNGTKYFPMYRNLKTAAKLRKEHYHLLVAGGGTAGTAMSNKFARILGKGKVAMIEPNENHYCQAMWTLIGAGIEKFEDSVAKQSDLLNSKCTLIKDRVGEFIPFQNSVITAEGKEISYDFLIIALGLQTRFDMIKGLPEAFEFPGVCSNYDPRFVKKTFPAIQNLKGGNAIFTFPNAVLKCAGGPFQIMCLAEELFETNGVRDKTNVSFNTGLGTVLPSPTYARRILEVMKKRNIAFNKRRNLVEINPETREAIFEILTDDGNAVIERKAVEYDMIHVAPPCTPVKEISENRDLTNDYGWVTVNKYTMQHTRFDNIFALGDCTDVPTSKTAAAVGSQGGVVRKNLLAVMNGKPPLANYDGYTSCPLVTTSTTCIMAEFDYSLKPKETFPFIDQRHESRLMFWLKRYIMPKIYWWGCLPGWWEGPKVFRKLTHLGMGEK